MERQSVSREVHEDGLVSRFISRTEMDAVSDRYINREVGQPAALFAPSRVSITETSARPLRALNFGAAGGFKRFFIFGGVHQPNFSFPLSFSLSLFLSLSLSISISISVWPELSARASTRRENEVIDSKLGRSNVKFEYAARRFYFRSVIGNAKRLRNACEFKMRMPHNDFGVREFRASRERQKERKREPFPRLRFLSQ